MLFLLVVPVFGSFVVAAVRRPVAPPRVRGRRLAGAPRRRPRPGLGAAEAARGQRLDADARPGVRALLLLASAGRRAPGRARRPAASSRSHHDQFPRRRSASQRAAAMSDARSATTWRRSSGWHAAERRDREDLRLQGLARDHGVRQRAGLDLPRRGPPSRPARLATTAASCASRPTRPAASRSTTSSAPPRPMPSSPSSAEPRRAGRLGARPALRGREPRRRAHPLPRRAARRARPSSATGSAGSASGDEGVIETGRCRGATCCYRQDEWKTKAFAANLDQLLVVVAAEPVFSESQLARALIAAAGAEHRGRIVLNKQRPAVMAGGARRGSRPTRRWASRCSSVALKKRAAARRARGWHRCSPAAATLVLGPSGAGKSTLVNLLVARRQGPGRRDLAGAQHRPAHDHGDPLVLARRRQRTSALIDSPGFQEFGLRHIAPNELAGLMPDIGRHASECRFYNCTPPARAGLRRAGGAGARRDRRVALPHLPRDPGRAEALKRHPSPRDPLD